MKVRLASSLTETMKALVGGWGSTVILGVVLLLSGWAIIGLGMLLFPTSNLLGGLGIVGALLNAVGIVIIVIALIVTTMDRLTHRKMRD